MSLNCGPCPEHLLDLIIDQKINPIKQYLERKIDINERYHSYTPLMMACQIGNLQIVKLLIKKGAVTSRCRVNPAMIAYILGHHDIVKYLNRKINLKDYLRTKYFLKHFDYESGKDLFKIDLDCFDEKKAEVKQIYDDIEIAYKYARRPYYRSYHKFSMNFEEQSLIREYVRKSIRFHSKATEYRELEDIRRNIFKILCEFEYCSNYKISLGQKYCTVHLKSLYLTREKYRLILEDYFPMVLLKIIVEFVD